MSRSKMTEDERRLRKSASAKRYREKKKKEDPNYVKNKNEESKKWRDRNPERAKEFYKKYKLKNKEKVKKRYRNVNERFSRARSKAKVQNREWNLSLEQYSALCKAPCHYCNDLLGIKSETGSGLDRKDSSLGYTNDNVVPCCFTCNTLKSNILSYAEAKQVIQLVLNLRKDDKCTI